MKVSVLGAGRWASCLALCLDRKNYDILMWEIVRDDGTENELFLYGKNQFVTLSDKVKYTHDLEKAVNYGEVLVISILSQQVDNFMQSIKKISGYENKKYVLAMKGIEASTSRRLSEILIDNGVKKENIAVFVGPGHVQSISVGQPTNMIVSAYNREYAKELIAKFQNPGHLDISYSDDIIGTEIGAASKNVIGIAAGILQGSGLEQKKGPLMPAALIEIGKFIKAMGGQENTAQSLSFLGDFQATLFDNNSKNLTYGKTIVEMGKIDNDAISKLFDVRSVEGIMTAKALLKKKDEFNRKASEALTLKMPITQAVDDIVSGRVPIAEAGRHMSDKITEALHL